MLFHMVQEIRIRTTNAAAFVHFKVCGTAAGLKADFPRKVDIPGGKGPCIDEPVDRAFTDGQAVLVMLKDMMGRLSLPDEGGDQFINGEELLLCQGETGTGFGESIRVFLLCLGGEVEALFKGTG